MIESGVAIKRLSLDDSKYIRQKKKIKQQLTKVFSKVLADGSNSAILLSFGNSFGRPNTMRDNRARIKQWNKN